MKVGLIDVDSHNFPNLPLMKISSYYKSKTNGVEWVQNGGLYDIVYQSKVFAESKEPNVSYYAHKIIKGGSGYDLMPYEIEHSTPDYSLYPEHNFALGWLTRGCPRVNHTFCITPKKDGKCVHKTADLKEFWTGQKKIVLLDQNLLACKERYELLNQLANSKAKVEFNGGLDIRFLNEKTIQHLRNIKVHAYHFAWDDPREDLFDKYKLFANSNLKDPGQVGVYVLVNYWSTLLEDLERIYKLRSLGFLPYVMIYNKQKFVDKSGNWLPEVGSKFTQEQLYHFKVCQHMQRWCNGRTREIKKTPIFENYEWYKKWVDKGCPVPLPQISLFN